MFWRTIRAMLGSGSLAAMMLLSGCKSAFVEAHVRNDTNDPVSLIEVDYPSASFGRESLAAHTSFQYRFKILGAGATKIQWTDAAHKEHTTAGPELHEGQEGTLEITIGEQAARWTVNLRP